MTLKGDGPGRTPQCAPRTEAVVPLPNGTTSATHKPWSGHQRRNNGRQGNGSRRMLGERVLGGSPYRNWLNRSASNRTRIPSRMVNEIMLLPP